MKAKFDVNFCLKGGRDYVQGPDIFDTTMKALAKTYHSLEKITYTAYKMLYTNATVYITEKVIKANYGAINSVMTFTNDGTKYYALVCENGKNIDLVMEYSEKKVEEQSIISNNMISSKNGLSNSFTEIVVSMNKWFLSQTIQEKGKWIVTKIYYKDLQSISNIDKKEIRVELVQNFNNQLTKSLLFIEDINVGHLYFSLIPKEH